MSRNAWIWLVLGWFGFAVLPWHLPAEAAGLLDWLVGYSAEGPRAALGLGLAGRWWLLPTGLPLVVATWPFVRKQTRERSSHTLVASGLAGLALIALQGFAIGLNGWRWSLLGEIFGMPGPSQSGMGLG